jgi:hypothetical protein
MQRTESKHWIHFAGLLAAGLACGALLSALTRAGEQLPDFGRGWFGYTFLLVLGAAALYAGWRWAGNRRALAWMMILAFGLRLGLGIALYLVLPMQSPQGIDPNAYQRYQAGYVFTDPYVRDRNAWEAASFHRPFWTVFAADFNGDQYGGLASLSTLVYETLSPDAHRPLIIVVLGALVAALGLPFFWMAIRQRWGEGVALTAAWIFALYPGSILLGASQMREPFLLTFSAIAFWGVLGCLQGLWPLGSRELAGRRGAGPVLAAVGGMLGLALFSFPVAEAVGAFLAVWIVLEWISTLDSKTGRLLGWGLIGLSAIVALLFFGSSLQDKAAWEFDVMIKNSGIIQGIARQLGEKGLIPFMTAYGLAQPVLPAAVTDPSQIWIRTVLNVLLATGWYALAPLLVYASLAVWKEPDPKERWVLTWSMVFTWVWILISSYRAGGDQWDNPRYRTIFLVWLALLAGWGWNWARAHRDVWLTRWLAVEGIFLALFTLWYANRKLGLGLPIGFWGAVALTVIFSGLVLVLGWISDRRGMQLQSKHRDTEAQRKTN